jgi:hypothetical protein
MSELGSGGSRTVGFLHDGAMMTRSMRIRVKGGRLVWDLTTVKIRWRDTDRRRSRRRGFGGAN